MNRFCSTVGIVLLAGSPLIAEAAPLRSALAAPVREGAIVFHSSNPILGALLRSVLRGTVTRAVVRGGTRTVGRTARRSGGTTQAGGQATRRTGGRTSRASGRAVRTGVRVARSSQTTAPSAPRADRQRSAGTRASREYATPPSRFAGVDRAALAMQLHGGMQLLESYGQDPRTTQADRNLIYELHRRLWALYDLFGTYATSDEELERLVDLEIGRMGMTPSTLLSRVDALEARLGRPYVPARRPVKEPHVRSNDQKTYY